MDRAAEIASLKARIADRRAAKPPRPTFELEARLRPLVLEQLREVVRAAEWIPELPRPEPRLHAHFSEPKEPDDAPAALQEEIELDE